MANGELRRKRRLIESARSRGEAVAQSIGDSWSRCRPVVDSDTRSAPVDIEPAEVRRRWEDSPIRRSNIGLEDQLGRAAETCDLVAAVTDDEGRILWTAGGASMRRAAEQVGFVPGGRWDETSAGTNALGLALRSGAPSTVFSAEHWCESVSDWVCWSVPVLDSAGRCLGVIDLSGRWDTASPLAELTVASLARLVQEHLPADEISPPPTLRLDLLGHPSATFGSTTLRIGLRQIELLAALALEGPCTLEELQGFVYGDRPVSPATIKAELSHLRKLLHGGIGSRPYRLLVPVEVDAVVMRDRIDRGDLESATRSYQGSLLSGSEAPFASDHRHVFDVCLRESLIRSGSTEQLMRFATVHPFDVSVLERAVATSPVDQSLHHEALARLELARRS